MINRWEVLECLREYPNKSRKQIAEYLNEDYEAVKKCILRFKNNGWIKEVKGSWVVLKTQVINKNDEKIRLAELLIQLLNKF